MEPHRPVAARLQRKPLGDCTNTISRTTQQQSSSSSSVKFTNPSLTSSLKRLVDQTSLKERNTDVYNSKVGAETAAPKPLSTNLRPVTRRISADLRFPSATCSRPPSKLKDVVDKLEASSTRVTRRMSTDLGFPASALPRRQNSRSGEGVGGGDKEVAEPYSVYTATRKASGRKRSKDSSSSCAVTGLRLDFLPSPGKKRRQAYENAVKPSKVVIKKQRTTKHEEDHLANGVSQDYIEKQRAYFAEIDAFELAEEEGQRTELSSYSPSKN
ncbi:hypothetical protein N665_0201s0329 [Sinapis alba]|nr:hypothetical protein N665_0201s0329 [Sinapis alba]